MNICYHFADMRRNPKILKEMMWVRVKRMMLRMLLNKIDAKQRKQIVRTLSFPELDIDKMTDEDIRFYTGLPNRPTFLLSFRLAWKTVLSIF